MKQPAAKAAPQRGRTPLDPKERARVRSIRLTDEHWEKLMRLGGVDWLRRRIEKERETQPTAPGSPAGDATMNLTELEARAMELARESNDGNGGDFGVIEDIVRGLPDLKPQAVGGLVASLSRKGLIKVYEPVTTDSGTWTQFTIAEEAGAKE